MQKSKIQEQSQQASNPRSRFNLVAALISTILICFPVEAKEALGSRLLVTFPWPIVQSELQHQSDRQPFQFQQTFQVPPLQIQGISVPSPAVQINVQIPRIDWQIHGFGEMESPWSAQIIARANNSEALLRVAPLSFRQVVERNIGPVRVRVFVDIQCEAFEVRNNQISSLAQFGLKTSEQSVDSNIWHFQLGWSSDSWQVSPIRCSGVQGIAETAQEQLHQFFSRPEQIAQWIEPQIAAQLKYWNEAFARNLVTSTLAVDQMASLQIVRFLRWGKGIAIELRDMKVEEDESAEAPKWEISFKQKNIDSNVGVHLSANYVDEKLRDWQKSQPKMIEYKLNDFAEFQSLLSSRWKQLFVWGDLWNYKKTDPFFLRVPQPPLEQLQWKEGDQVSAVWQGQVDAWLISYRKEKFWNYIRVRNQSQIQFVPQIEGTDLVLRIEPSMKGWKSEVGKEYQARFGRPLYSEKRLLQAVQSLLKPAAVRVPIPKLQLPGASAAGMELRVKSVENSGQGFLWLPMELAHNPVGNPR